jgi:hypothetical protein
LHTLSVSANGTLSEPTAPVILSTAGVPGDAHPQGIAVVTSRLSAPVRGGDEGSGDDGTAVIGSIPKDAAALPVSSDGLVSSAIADLDDAELAFLLTGLG